MGPRPARALATAAAAIALVAPAASAAPPTHGVLIPGQSLGGLRIGMTKAQVRQAWGTSFGRCRDCFRETWYFNYEKFKPAGAGVIFERGHVAQIFTVWQPEGWRTAKGLVLGAADWEVKRAYPDLEERTCVSYSALVMPGPRAQTVFYLDKAKLWGFGLTRPDSSPCV